MRPREVPEEAQSRRKAQPGWRCEAAVRGVLMLSSPNVSHHSQALADFTLKNRVPAISPLRPFAMAAAEVIP